MLRPLTAFLWGVFKILRRLSPGPSCGSELVDVLQPENVTGPSSPRFHYRVPGSGIKYRDSIM